MGVLGKCVVCSQHTDGIILIGYNHKGIEQWCCENCVEESKRKLRLQNFIHEAHLISEEGYELQDHNMIYDFMYDTRVVDSSIEKCTKLYNIYTIVSDDALGTYIVEGMQKVNRIGHLLGLNQISLDNNPIIISTAEEDFINELSELSCEEELDDAGFELEGHLSEFDNSVFTTDPRSVWTKDGIRAIFEDLGNGDYKFIQLWN